MKQGYHVQFNIVDSGMLRDAQKSRKYRDLLVEWLHTAHILSNSVRHCQNDIIARVEFQEV